MPAPDETAFRSHIDEPAFRAGVLQGRWHLLGIVWPHALVTVSAPHRPRAPDAYALRFELSDYPATAPTATPWDCAAGTQLGADGRPKGDRLDLIFRTNWEGGRALYIPCDRVAIGGHGSWPQQYAEWAWDGTRDITHYLKLVWDRLNADDYLGV